MEKIEYKVIIDPRYKVANVSDFDNFMDFLIQEIYNARENHEPRAVMSVKHDETVRIGDSTGANISDGQIKKLKEYKQCFESLPKETWEQLSGNIRMYICSYNADFDKGYDKKWKEYKNGQNENDIRRRVIGRIEALRKEVESFEEEYPNEWDREAHKDLEYYKLGSLLDEFKEALTVDKYTPHLGFESDPKTMWTPPFKYFRAESENKKALHWFFKSLNGAYKLKCHDRFKRLVNSL